MQCELNLEGSGELGRKGSEAAEVLRVKAQRSGWEAEAVHLGVREAVPDWSQNSEVHSDSRAGRARLCQARGLCSDV